MMNSTGSGTARQNSDVGPVAGYASTNTLQGDSGGIPAHHLQQQQRNNSIVGTPNGQTQEIRYSCDQCSSSFRRPEHLRRHQRDHLHDRPFVCAMCGKKFSRNDTLQRHKQIHTLGATDEVRRGPKPGPRTNKACVHCAASRARCSGGDPCARCASKALNCEYPAKRRRVGKLNETETSDRSVGSPSVEGGHHQDQGMGHITRGGEATPGPFAMQDFDSPSTSPHDITTSTIGPPQNKAQGLSNAIMSQTTHIPTPKEKNSGLLGNPTQSAAGMVFSPPVDTRATHDDLSRYGQSNPNYEGTSHISAPTAYFPNGEIMNTDTDNGDAVGSLSTATPGYGMLDQYANISSINWLPTDFTADIDYSVMGLSLSSNISSRLSSNTHNMQFDPAQQQQQRYTPRMSYQSLHQPEPSGEHYDQQEPERTLEAQLTSVLKGRRVQGEYYVDSEEGARIPCSVRARRKSAMVVGVDSQSPASSLPSTSEFPPHTLVYPEITHDLPGTKNTKQSIDLVLYSTLKENFMSTCLSTGRSSLFPSFENPQFPPLTAFNYFIAQYFSHFHPVFPIIHVGTLDLNTCHWLVALALAALGCQYSEVGGCGYPMQEFLRRAVLFETEKLEETPAEPWLIQATLLSQIGMLYSGSPRLKNNAHRNHERLVEYVRQSRLLAESRSSHNPIEQDWTGWVVQERGRRTGYAIWLLDCMMHYHFDQLPLLSVESGVAPLPCAESLWDAEDAGSWSLLVHKQEATPSLSTALHRLYISKKVLPTLSEFSRVILLHSIFSETLSVATYHSRPLSTWAPSAPSTSPNHHPTNPSLATSPWLPEIPTFSAWRNAACDCIDVLHWAANGTIAQLSGIEHPTVFHLHAARIVLLTPYRHIRTLTIPVNINYPPTEKEREEAETEVKRWATRDQRKARLAMIHAGCLLWHVRRYSTLAFYEPPAVLLVTLALWAYSTYTPLPPSTTTQDRSGSSSPNSPATTSSRDSAESDTPTFIRLDRPNDDEMVQLFVRDGSPQRMRAYVSGVRNVVGKEAPGRILREGAKILGAMAGTWGVAGGWVRGLEGVAGRNNRAEGRFDGGSVVGQEQ